MDFRPATPEDIPGILELQDLNLVTNLSEDQKGDGFVTTPFTPEQILTSIEEEGLFVAAENQKIVAYLFAGSWAFYSQWPIFNYMTSRFPTVSFGGQTLSTETSFQYGPVCIAKERRGQGIIFPLFETMRVALSKRYETGVTFINQRNQRSFGAHTQKLNWTVVDEFEFNHNSFYMLAYDMSQQVG